MRIGQKTKKKKLNSESNVKPSYSNLTYLEYNRTKSSVKANDTTYSINNIITGVPYFDLVTFASYIGVPLELLNALSIDTISSNYSTFYIDKNTNRIVSYADGLDLREINAPFTGLKTIQLALMHLFQEFPMHECNHAFVQGKNIKSAAESVSGGKALIHADLVHFFDEHTWVYVNRKFREVLAKTDIKLSDKLINFICTAVCRNNTLPQGSPCSPLLTIILNYDMDERINDVAKKFGLTYSRYADDLWFSGDIANDNIRPFKDALSEAVHPFRLNHKKFGVMKDTAYPLLRGVNISLGVYIPPSQIASVTGIIKDNLKLLDPDLKIFGKYINCDFKCTENIDDTAIKEGIEQTVNALNTKYPKLKASYKLKFFYIQSIKRCLGMNIVGGNIKYPRKDYLKMRLYAYLIGKQNALLAIRSIIIKHKHPELLGLLNTFSSDHKVSLQGNGKERRYRNLSTKFFNIRVFKGKVNFLKQVDKDKGLKIDAIVSRTEKYWLSSFVKYIDSQCCDHSTASSIKNVLTIGG